MKMPLFQRAPTAPNCEQRGWPGTFQVKIVVVAKVNYLHKQPGSDSVSIRLTGADCFRVPQNGNNARLRWLRWTEFRQGFQGTFSQRLTSMNKKYPNHVLLILATVGAIYSRTTQKTFLIVGLWYLMINRKREKVSRPEEIFRYITDTTPTHIIEFYQNNWS